MIYITADTHLGHSNIIKYCNRPFHNVKEMDNCIISNINKVVGAKDVLWHLGDFSFGRQEYYRSLIKCENVCLVRGNHDYACSEKALERCFDRVCDLYVLKGLSRRCVFSHYAFLTWPHRHHGAVHCFGHSHGKLEGIQPASMDVGVDTNHFRPYNLQEVINILSV